MPSIFPGLLDYSLIAPLILRVALGLLFVSAGYRELTREQQRWREIFDLINFRPAIVWVKIFGVAEIVGGLFLIVGLFTQPAALLFIIISLAECFIEYRAPIVLKQTVFFYILILVISISLLLTGAGYMAFDLPL